MVAVELPLRNLLMTMWCFSDCNLFVLFCDPFDVAAEFFCYCCCSPSLSTVIRSRKGTPLAKTFQNLKL